MISDRRAAVKGNGFVSSVKPSHNVGEPLLHSYSTCHIPNCTVCAHMLLEARAKAESERRKDAESVERAAACAGYTKLGTFRNPNYK